MFVSDRRRRTEMEENMASGSNFVRLPESNQYDGVSGHAISFNANSIPSGGEVNVSGHHFWWKLPDEPTQSYYGGFTGQSWYVYIENGPTAYFNGGQFTTDEDVYNYLTQPGSSGNLNAVFAEWQAYLNSLYTSGEDWKAVYDRFFSAVPNDCVSPF